MSQTLYLKPSAREALARELRDLQGGDDWPETEESGYPERQLQAPVDWRTYLQAGEMRRA